jgi:hypothetical protein
LVNGKFAQQFVENNERLVEAVTKIDAAGEDAYFAVGGYGPDNNRTQANVVAMSCFMVDIDTQEGKPGEKYVNRAEAIQRLGMFRKNWGCTNRG